MRTKDVDRVYRILTNESVKKMTYFQDFTKEKIKSMLGCDGLYFLSPHRDSLFVFIQNNPVSCEGHSFVLPDRRGRKGIKDAQKAIQWLFDNTECVKVFGFTPENNVAANRFNALIGMKREGLNTNSDMVDGKLQNRILWGISKEV